MTNFIKKVDRVKSVVEAKELQNLGVDLIGVSLNENHRFMDDRCIRKEVAISIKRELQKSKIVGEIVVGYSFSNILSVIEEVGFDYIQVESNELPPIEFRKELQSKGIGLIYAGIEVSYEDDPSWILSRYKNEPYLNASFFQIDLLGEIENSWEFFKKESPKYPDELQIEDIKKIAEQDPLIVTIDYSVDNVLEIFNKIPSAKGMNMSLCEAPNRNDIHCFSYLSAVEILTHILTC